MIRTYGGAVAVVTGGASGIGRALSEALARRGATVILADVMADRAEDVAVAIRRAGGRATAIGSDVADPAAVDHLIANAVATHGRLDYLFNNAGVGLVGWVHHHNLEEWEEIININLRGVVHGIRAAYPVMLRQGFGHIVNTASMAGLIPSPGLTVYGAIKYAIVGLSTALRIEAAPRGVRVSVLCPGVIRTPLLEAGRSGMTRAAIPIERQRAYFERMRPMDPARFADRSLREVARNRAIVVIPAWWKLYWWVHRLSPTLGLALARRSFEATAGDLWLELPTDLVPPLPSESEGTGGPS
jgi:NAD(P)-dependent dehydrogenase (short-subunit alcohol dehydrogenase family)